MVGPASSQLSVSWARKIYWLSKIKRHRPGAPRDLPPGAIRRGGIVPVKNSVIPIHPNQTTRSSKSNPRVDAPLRVSGAKLMRNKQNRRKGVRYMTIRAPVMTTKTRPSRVQRVINGSPMLCLKRHKRLAAKLAERDVIIVEGKARKVSESAAAFTASLECVLKLFVSSKIHTNINQIFT